MQTKVPSADKLETPNHDELLRALERERRARAIAEALVEDRTKSVQIAYANLRAQDERRFVEALNLLPCPILIVNQKREILLANPEAVKLRGETGAESLQGLPLEHVILQVTQDSHLASQSSAAILLQKEGNNIAVEIRTGEANFQDQACQIIIIRDLSEQRSHQQALHHQATHDALTGLPNRVLLVDRISHAISHAQRDQSQLAIFFIDLDKFKYINDSLGHDTGDLVLREMARRLNQNMRDTDTVGRLGGDEFIVVCDILITDECELIARRILDSLHQPIQLGPLEQVMGGSVGIAIFPDDGETADALLKRADIAMYHAKSNGSDKAQRYSAEMQVEADDRLLLEIRLRHAIFNNELILYYQPQIDLRSGTLTGFEALVRWNSPHYGMVPPIRFIPVAEETQLIKSLGLWVLDTACAQIRKWHEEGFGWLMIAVNLSATEFCSHDTVSNIEAAIRKHAIPAECLELELTESLSLNDPEASIETMHQIKKLGVRLSIDDFGVGYSNLGYLRRFPADCLKIDQTFTRGLCRNPEDRAIIKTVIQLAHSLSMLALAEGAETEDEVRQLYALGADRVQGFWISRPVPPQDLEYMLLQPLVLDPGKLMPNDKKLKILLVDDSEMMLELIAEGLSDTLPVEVMCAPDVKTAVSLLLTNQFLAVISDYYLPEETGVELLAKARKMMPGATRILITGSPDTQLLREAINLAGVEHFLGKPIDLNQLCEIIANCISQVSAQ